MLRLVLLALIVVVGLGIHVPEPRSASRVRPLVSPTEPEELVSTGRTPYFILEPGYSLVLEGGQARLTITVLNETRKVDGVETRIVEERETRGGKLVEVARNYVAIGKRTGDVVNLGEDVDVYEDGRVVSHAGTWLAGVNGGKSGLVVPGRVSVGARYYQEIAPEVAPERATIVGMRETVGTPAGEFTNCLKVEETAPLQGLTTEYKYYAPGIGLVQDGALKLVRVTGEGGIAPVASRAPGALLGGLLAGVAALADGSGAAAVLEATTSVAPAAAQRRGR